MNVSAFKDPALQYITDKVFTEQPRLVAVLTLGMIETKLVNIVSCFNGNFNCRADAEPQPCPPCIEHIA